MSLRVGTPMPALDGATDWLNGKVDCASLLDSPTLIQFWAVSCPLCKTNMPQIRRWKDIYGLYNLVSVHVPRTEADTHLELVQRVAEDHGIVEPCAVDNELVISGHFETGGMWPYYFLFDSEGKMRCRAAGTGGLRLVEDSLKRLLRLTPSTL